jgi:hypothetical protein
LFSGELRNYSTVFGELGMVNGYISNLCRPKVGVGELSLSRPEEFEQDLDDHSAPISVNFANSLQLNATTEAYYAGGPVDLTALPSPARPTAKASCREAVVYGWVERALKETLYSGYAVRYGVRFLTEMWKEPPIISVGF